MRNELTMNEFLHGLRELGVKRDMLLEVHTALSSLGTVRGGAKTIIDALMHTVGDGGTIVMPSFRLSHPMALDAEDEKMGLTMKLRRLPEGAETSGMGAVADAFRRRADVVNGEGIFQFSAWGRHAEPCARDLGYLIERGGRALMLGVDIYRLSAMHAVEDALPEAIKAKFHPPEAVWDRYDREQWFIEAWTPPEKPWYKIQTLAHEKGLIQSGMIGQAHCMLMDVKGVVELYRQALIEDAYGLYGIAEKE